MLSAGGGGVSGGAGACSAAACGCEVEGPPVMSYVGPRQGDYSVETTYKYTGYGTGEFALVAAPRSSFFCLYVGGGLAFVTLVAIVVILLWPPPTTTTTTADPYVPLGSCLLWGDPHIETLDHARVDFFSEGEFWLVKSAQVHIQGRYSATPFTNGLSAFNTIAIGGPCLKGHVIKVGPMQQGQITWDNQPILTAFPSVLDLSTSGLGKISYNGEGQLVDPAEGHVDKKVVHMDFPGLVHIQVLRWANHINVRVTMPAQAGGQDGHCGNFNGNAADDAIGAVEGRIGRGVAPGDLLFRTVSPMVNPGKTLTLDDCDASRKAIATSTCQHTRANMEHFQSCVFDVCFGGPQYAAQDALYG